MYFGGTSIAGQVSTKRQLVRMCHHVYKIWSTDVKFPSQYQLNLNLKPFQCFNEPKRDSTWQQMPTDEGSLGLFVPGVLSLRLNHSVTPRVQMESSQDHVFSAILDFWIHILSETDQAKGKTPSPRFRTTSQECEHPSFPAEFHRRCEGRKKPEKWRTARKNSLKKWARTSLACSKV